MVPWFLKNFIVKMEIFSDGGVLFVELRTMTHGPPGVGKTEGGQEQRILDTKTVVR